MKPPMMVVEEEHNQDRTGESRIDGDKSPSDLFSRKRLPGFFSARWASNRVEAAAALSDPFPMPAVDDDDESENRGEEEVVEDDAADEHRLLSARRRSEDRHNNRPVLF